MKFKKILFISLLALPALSWAQENTGADIVIKKVVPALIATGTGIIIAQKAPEIATKLLDGNAAESTIEVR